jgi:hypothetical protein
MEYTFVAWFLCVGCFVVRWHDARYTDSVETYYNTASYITESSKNEHTYRVVELRSTKGHNMPIRYRLRVSTTHQMGVMQSIEKFPPQVQAIRNTEELDPRYGEAAAKFQYFA